jgi:hypothetical protein
MKVSILFSRVIRKSKLAPRNALINILVDGHKFFVVKRVTKTDSGFTNRWYLYRVIGHTNVWQPDEKGELKFVGSVIDGNEFICEVRCASVRCVKAFVRTNADTLVIRSKRHERTFIAKKDLTFKFQV